MGHCECFDGVVCVEVPFRDILKFVDAVERLVRTCEWDRSGFNRDVFGAKAYVREIYSGEREKSGTLTFDSSLFRNEVLL
jgi:hypothetical protein